MTAFTGNAVTAERYRDHFCGLGYTSELASIDDGAVGLRLRVGRALSAGSAVVVVAIHAFRAGRLALGLPDEVRIVTVLSGTDMNKYALDGERAALMRSVIARSSAVVALSEPLMTACRAMIGSGPQPPAWRDEACAAVVNCSAAEGLSNAVLEAMALGKAVVASDIPGNRAALCHGRTGWLEGSDRGIAERVMMVASRGDAEGVGAAAREEVLSGAFAATVERCAWAAVLAGALAVPRPRAAEPEKPPQ
ncbi:hypothetical protein FNF27_06326 [Cafeteria roenbergensis]|uniref:Glycosyl transferase family 1 domain-containing protein n=1 Tax=Cafeteria roenbergensis TaxID=33653 RepID=A0A5A8C1V3_CAFRO|nr:hypothetical protein FNF29_07759 [Cafeteria roenbergensis]KAA0171416.1 hypothetical protein FNF27_06326 [Cafeteria roenbergensis]|eukprot:KAA0146878.1 hypothetical protein FNF29_07759 [Cafeteria roenbergensis]